MTMLNEQYPDLLSDRPDPTLARVVADLDRVREIATAATVSPRRDAAIRQALYARALTREPSRRVFPLHGRLAALAAALVIVLGGLGGYPRSTGPAPVSAQTVLSRAAAVHLVPNQAAHLTYWVTVTDGARIIAMGTADTWIQGGARGIPMKSAQTLSLGTTRLSGRYVRIGAQVYAYNSLHRTILVSPEARAIPSWVVPPNLFNGASLAQDLRVLAERSPRQVQAQPRQTLAGKIVDVIIVDGWMGRPAQRTTFYFDAQTYALRGFDAVSADPSYPTASWKARLSSEDTVAAAAVPARTFTLNAPVTARVVAPAPNLGALARTCHGAVNVRMLLATETRSVLAACQITAPGMTEVGLVDALDAQGAAALATAEATGQITGTQAANGLAALRTRATALVLAG
ncbi:MAG TPA: hypothetical protein VNL71_00185 [Chloroflexota bacterium]|nr:hypothetical protein [Chloroflexota bacterium]